MTPSRPGSILNCCNAGVIVSRDAAAVPEWRGALLVSDIEILAVVESVQTPAREILGTKPLHLRLGPLQRGSDVKEVPPGLMQAIGLPSG